MPEAAAPVDSLKILLIEDDPQTADFIVRGLEEASHSISVAHNGRDGLARALAERWDLLVIDRMLPEIDGLQIVQSLRQSDSSAAVLLLTTLGGVDDRVQGLNAGADDYLNKPFAFSELLARVTALGRRTRRHTPETALRIANLEMNLLTRTVVRGAEHIELMPREFQLLEYLMRHADQTVTRSMLLENVWDVHFDPNTNVVETLVSRLRGKIDRGNAVPLIHTIRGVGYSLRDPK
jgi:two-component system OmpR family response regulator